MLHKLLAGLLDAGTVGANPQALGVLERAARWFHRWSGRFDHDQLDDIPWGAATTDFWCCHGTLLQAHTDQLGVGIHGDAQGVRISRYVPMQAVVDVPDIGPVRVSIASDVRGGIVTGQRHSVAGYQGIQWPTCRRDRARDRTAAWSASRSARLSPHASPSRCACPTGTSGEPAVTLHGRAVHAVRDGGLRVVEREWSGETMELTLGTRLEAVPLPDQPGTIAFVDGGVVLAGILDEERRLVGDPADPPSLLQPDEERRHSWWNAHTWRTIGQSRGAAIHGAERDHRREVHGVLPRGGEVMTWTLPEQWNPILPGFHPDPSIVEVDGTYVLATSTFEWWPGVKLHTSTDLVGWTPAGAVFTDPEGLDLSDVPELGGLWAPSISYVDGRFWLVNACVRTPGPQKDIDVLLTTASDLSGPWTRPVRLGGGGFDPSIFHEDGRHWLVNMRWDSRPDRFSFAGITIQEIDQTGPIDDERLVLTSEHLQEGPNLYAIDGWYYLMMAEGGTDWNHGIRVARSRELYGAYEVDPEPLLTSRDDPTAMLGKAGHGELLRTPDGGWAIVHLAGRPIDRPDGRFCVLGRETCLEPVVWADGWPRLAHGGHLPAGFRPHDEVGAYPVTLEDTFDQPTLDQRWVTLRTPPDGSWLDLSSRPGWLRLGGRRGLAAQTQVSLVATRLLSTYCTVTTEVEVKPVSFVQAAGLAIWYDRRGYHTLLVRGSEQGPQIVIATSDLGTYTESETGLLVAGWASVHLRAELRGLSLRFAVSPDGLDWQEVGDELDLAVTSDDHGVMRFTGTMIALLATDTGPRTLWAAFSGIRVVN